MHNNVSDTLTKKLGIQNATVVSATQWTLPTQTLNVSQLHELIVAQELNGGKVTLEAGVLTLWSFR